MASPKRQRTEFRTVSTFWVDFLRSLKARGLDGPKLAIDAAHRCLRAAIERAVEATWQRCRAPTGFRSIRQGIGGRNLA